MKRDQDVNGVRVRCEQDGVRVRCEQDVNGV